MDAAQNGDTAEAKRLLDAGAPIDWTDDAGEAPLHHASWHKRLDTVMMLTKHKANLNITGNNGNTPLLYAAHQGEEKIVRALVKARGDPSIRGWGDKDAAVHAKEEGHDNIAEYLTPEVQRQQVHANIVHVRRHVPFPGHDYYNLRLSLKPLFLRIVC